MYPLPAVALRRMDPDGSVPQHRDGDNTTQDPRPRSIRRKPGLLNLSRSDLSLPTSGSQQTSTTSGATAREELEPDREHSRPSDPARTHPSSSRSRAAVASVLLTFEQLGFSEMTVRADTSSRVQYHVSVHMNCFAPTSHITVVRRWRVDGELIGSFECVFPFRAPWLAHIHAARVLTACGVGWVSQRSARS